MKRETTQEAPAKKDQRSQEIWRLFDQKKVQKSSNKLPASKSRESTAAFYGTEKKTREVKPEKKMETLGGVIFQTSDRPSVV